MTKKEDAEKQPPVNMLKAVPKLTPDEWRIIAEALSYSSLDGQCPSRQEICFYASDQVIRGLEREMLQPASRDSTPHRNEPWLRSDLLFLKDSLAHGMSYAEVAGFLGRTEEEVRRKAEESD
jgi:hypothetical protein